MHKIRKVLRKQTHLYFLSSSIVRHPNNMGLAEEKGLSVSVHLTFYAPSSESFVKSFQRL